VVEVELAGGLAESGLVDIDVIDAASTQRGELKRDACLQLLRSAPIGRVIVVTDQRSIVLPVNHVMDGENVVFQVTRTLRTSILGEDLLTFQADGTSSNAIDWSVTVQGAFDVIDGLPTLQPPPGFEPSAHAFGAEIPTVWVRIRPDVVTGRVIEPITLD
jgi:nitroimidazol reductase NimA-like FMN-containing flavoprotein (pyridoxamine 5'-phosphate oxidase superfamily)